jgi:hypothetical protein
MSDALGARSRQPPPGPARCWAVGTLGPGSAGASTLAVAVATAAGGLLVEADADGGELGARHGAWLNDEAPSLGSLLAALEAYPGTGSVEDHLHQLPGGARVALVASDAEAALDPVRRLVDDLEDLRRELAGETLVLDVGRVRPDSPALMLAGQADALIAVVRPQVESLSCLMARLPALLPRIQRLVVAVRGEGPYALADLRAAIAMQAGARIAVVGVPEDASGVQALSRGRQGSWSVWGSGRTASLMHSAGVMAMLLKGPAPEDERPVPTPEGLLGPGASMPLTFRLDDERSRRRAARDE